MNSICLTADEIRQITGYRSRRHQVQWLRAQGILVRVRPDGSPVVSREHFEHVMGARTDDVRTRREPDFSCLQ